MTLVQWFYFLAIVCCACCGGYLPLTRPTQARCPAGFPRGEAFSAGVFLAISLTMLLPSAFAVFRTALPAVKYPVSSVIAIVAFLILLAIEHLSGCYASDSARTDRGVLMPAAIPLIMTCMIAAPSFFLGAALGMSDPAAALLIFVAIVLHKGTAAFALASTMVRSTLTRRQTIVLFTLFAFITPMGIVLGQFAAKGMGGSALVVKGTFLALGAGTFLYMGTVHEMKHASLIEHCRKPSCFACMFAGLLITAIVRWLVGEAHLF